MDSVKDVFKRELRKKFIALTFSRSLFGNDSEMTKDFIKEFDWLYKLSNELYPDEKIFGGF